jgi:hypothetical protein
MTAWRLKFIGQISALTYLLYVLSIPGRERTPAWQHWWRWTGDTGHMGWDIRHLPALSSLGWKDIPSQLAASLPPSPLHPTILSNPKDSLFIHLLPVPPHTGGLSSVYCCSFCVINLSELCLDLLCDHLCQLCPVEVASCCSYSL